MSFKPPGYCPNCGEWVEAGATSCKACGSCPETGWNEDSVYDGLDLPDWEEEASSPKGGHKLQNALVTVVLVAALLYVFVFR